MTPTEQLQKRKSIIYKYWVEPENLLGVLPQIMDEWASIREEETAIEVLEWILKEAVLPRDTNWFDAGKHYTSKELYTLFLNREK